MCRSHGVAPSRHRAYDADGHPDAEAVATVVKGTADLSTPLSTCRLRAGTFSSATRGKTCSTPTVVDVRPVVGWSQPLLVP